MGKAVNKKTWEEFRNSGLLWFINTILHMFGWAIVFDMENDKVINTYPARVVFRGFDPDSNDEGYKKVIGWIKDNIEEINKETQKG